MLPPGVSPFDDETEQAIRAALAGDTMSPDMSPSQASMPAPQQPASVPVEQPATIPPEIAAAAQRETYPSERSSGASKQAIGDVDPGLAFFAAFSGNPVLQKMVEESRNRPRAQAEFDRQQAQEGRAQEKWKQERDLMAPLKADKLRNENALGAASLEGKQPGSPYSKAFRQNAYELLTTHASRLAAAGLPGPEQVQRMAQGIAQNENLSADAVERMMRGIPGMTDKIIGDARNAALDAEKTKMGEAQRTHLSEQDKNARARIDAMRQKSLEPKTSARERAVQAKNQDKLDDEVEKADWAKRMLMRVADLKQHVNTGPVAGRLQNAAQHVGLSSGEFDNMKQTLSQVSNRIIKELSGSAVTGNEWGRMQDELANIMNDDSNFETKLANMIELTESIKQMAINKYARAGTDPVNPTNTARRVTAQQPRVNAGETAPPDATPKPSGMRAPPGKAPGSLIRQKSTGKTFRVTQDGMLEEVR